MGARRSRQLCACKPARSRRVRWQGVSDQGQHEATAFELLLAAIGFLCASAGSILVTQGGHIFDKVEISQRWRTRD